jgi:hypothetical protein
VRTSVVSMTWYRTSLLYAEMRAYKGIHMNGIRCRVHEAIVTQELYPACVLPLAMTL